MGIALWLLVVIPGLIFLRRQPEDLGLLPDGAEHSPRLSPVVEFTDATAASLEYSWSRADAARTATLWLLVAGAFLSSLGTGGVAFHLAAYLTDSALTAASAAGVVSLMALSGAVGNGAWGALAERFHPRQLSVLTLMVAAASVALLMHVRSAPTAYFFALLFGVHARGAAVLTQVLVARYFGRRSFGAISSILDPFHKSGLGLGALFAGAAYDSWSGYRGVFVMFLASYLVAALFMFLARQPVQNDRLR